MTTHFDMTLDESVQVLKRVLPMMSQQRVPTIPQNYAVRYDYVTHRNDELCSELESHIKSGLSFNADQCRRIYEKYFVDEVSAEVGGIQGAVREAVNSVLQEVSSLGNDMSGYSEVLAAAGSALGTSPTQEDLNQLVVNLVRETQKTRARAQEVEASLHTMGDELTEMKSQISRLSRDLLECSCTKAIQPTVACPERNPKVTCRNEDNDVTAHRRPSELGLAVVMQHRVDLQQDVFHPIDPVH